MAFKKIVVAVLVASLFAVGGLAAYQVGEESQDAAAQQTANQTGEDIVLEADAWQYVNKATAEHTTGFANDSVTVVNESGTTLVRGTDYTWNATDGTVLFDDTSPRVTDGENGTIDYQYRENTPEVQEVAGPLSQIVRGQGRIGVLAGGLGLVVLLLGVGAIVAKVFGTSGRGPTRGR